MDMVFWSRSWKKWDHKNVVKFRYDPVPLTSCRSASKKFLRRMKTTQERRWTYAYPGFVRGKRSARNIPNAWDDFWRPFPTSWKDCTKKTKQWM